MYESLELLVEGVRRRDSDGITGDVLAPATESVPGLQPVASLADPDRILELMERQRVSPAGT